MKIETLHFKRKRYFLYVLVVGVLLLIFNLSISKAKYKTVESIPIVRGTIKNYSPYDFKLLAIKIENDKGEYETTDTIPTSGYMINKENSYCTIPDENGNDIKDDSITIEYTDGLINFLGMSKRNTKCSLYFNINRGPIDFDYTGDVQTFIADASGNYQIELWGARNNSDNSEETGYGAYVKGVIKLKAREVLYLYIGEMGKASLNGAWNGGGNSGKQTYGTGYITGSGGGGSDLRCFSNVSNECIEYTGDLTWNSAIGLASRIIVSAGGGGTGSYFAKGGSGGGLSGYNATMGALSSSYSSTASGFGATQTESPYISGGFGYGGAGPTDRTAGGGGGGGYYGGGAGAGGWASSYNGGGGSSFISGHTGCVAIKSSTDITPKDGCTTGTADNTCSIHYSGKTFTDTLMIDGAGYSWTNVKGEQVQMPNPQGGYYDLGVGHTGNGYARITYLGN